MSGPTLKEDLESSLYLASIHADCALSVDNGSNRVVSLAQADISFPKVLHLAATDIPITSQAQSVHKPL